MALSFSVKNVISKGLGGRKLRVANITLDNAYPTGGWPITAANLNLHSKIEALIPGSVPGYNLVWDDANKKIIANKTGSALSGVLLEASASEAGLNGLITTAIVLGY